MSLRSKLLLGFLTVAVVALGVFSAVVLEFQQASTRDAQREAMGQLVDEAGRLAKESEFAQDPLMLLEQMKSLLKNRRDLAWCRIVAPGAPPVTLGSATSAQRVVLRECAEGKTRLELAFSASFLEEQRRKTRARALHDLGEGALIVVPIAALLGAFLSLRLSRRFTALGAAVAEIGKGRFGISTRVGGSDEVGKLAREIDAMSAKLGELEVMKKTFVASVTHELRSPLAAIESTVKLILSQPAQRSPLDVEMLHRIQANSARLGRFVTNMLEMAKIERGKLEYNPREASLQDIVRDAALLFEPRARELGIALTVRSEEGKPPRLRLDTDLMTQVVSNLLSNALKFTPRGGSVEVTVLETWSKGSRQAECRVRDSGVGIPREAQARLFAPFERVPNQLRAQGAGLGLAICKSILELHKGSIGVESAAGTGSTFYFSLPTY